MSEPAPATPLERLLARTSQDPSDTEALDHFLAALLPGIVGVPGVAGDDGFAPIVVTAGGEPVAAAFTHQVRWESFADQAGLDRSEVEVRPAPVREVFEQLVDHDVAVVLNPGSAWTTELRPAAMRDLLDGLRPGTRERFAQQPQHTAVGAPASLPEGLADRMAAHLGRIAGVESAALAWTQQADGRHCYLLGIRGTAARDDVLGGDFRAIAGELDHPLDVLFAAPGAPLPTDSVEPLLGT